MPYHLVNKYYAADVLQYYRDYALGYVEKGSAFSKKHPGTETRILLYDNPRKKGKMIETDHEGLERLIRDSYERNEKRNQ